MNKYYWLVINQDGQPIYDVDFKRYLLFRTKEAAEYLVKNRARFDKSIGRKRYIVQATILFNPPYKVKFGYKSFPDRRKPKI